MAPTPSVKIVKQSSYKGGLKVWSNRFHFNGGTPADLTHWNTLFDNIVAAEKLTHLPGTVIIEAVGYGAGSDVPVASKTYSTAGTYTASGDITVPLVMAALIRWSTTARSAKNHPIYLFSYMHGCARQASSDLEQLATAQKTLFETYATAWISGFSDGTNTYVRAGPNGATGTSRLVNPELTHRDFRD